jgi:GTPase SAR1 family protein
VDELPLDVMIALVGNKIDLEQDRQVLVDEIKEYVAEKDLIYIETSARLGININHVFNEIGNNPSLITLKLTLFSQPKMYL